MTVYKQVKTSYHPSIKRKQTDYQKKCASAANTKHGLSRHKTYSVWAEIKQRCNNPNSTYYHNYGGRGISYDPNWENFENFWDDMGSTYIEGLLIDRIDNNSDYCKENCKWSTRSEQMNNTRHTQWYTLNGTTKTATQWAKELNLTAKFINRRRRDGWTDEQALVTPKNKNRKA